MTPVVRASESSGRSGVDVAIVTFPAPHGTDSVSLGEGDEATFGRGSDCTIRFGFAPTIDASLARLAGSFYIRHGRVNVECNERNRFAFEVLAPGRPPQTIAVGSSLGPAESQFAVIVPTPDRQWRLEVFTKPRAALAVPTTDDVQTRALELPMTTTEQKIVDAYLAPMRQGSLAPEAHSRAAAAVSYSESYTRKVIYDIYGRMFAAGVPLIPVEDKVQAVAHAMLHHCLVRTVDD